MSRLYAVVTATVVVALFGPPLLDLLGRLDSISVTATMQFFLMPVWMTFFALPFVYALAVFYAYESAFNQLRNQSDQLGSPVQPWMRAAIVLTGGLTPWGANRVTGLWMRELAATSSIGEARKLLRSLRADADFRAARKAKAAADLERYTGVSGTDVDGRQLDKREFAATTNALELLDAYASADLQSGGFHEDVATRNGGRLLGLPHEHGIEVEVSESRKSYRAWRRTPSGWCFGIGRSTKASTTYYYEGPEPPTSYPPGPEWRDEETLNWIVEDW